MPQIGRIPVGQVLSREQEVGIINLVLEASYWSSPMLNEYLGQVEPPVELRRTALAAYADGTNWNPDNMGEGLYRYSETYAKWLPITGMTVPVATKTADYTANISDYMILCNAASGNIVITLPAAAGIKGKIYIVKKTDSSANTVTIDGNAAETIDGSATSIIQAQNTAVCIVSDNTNWHIY